MTKFEQWKDSLTLKDFLEGFLMCIPCNKCPAKKTCIFDSDECEGHFKRWAESEVKHGK